MPRFLLLRLEAPLVAFGDISVDARGPVSDLPSASMLTGLLANALGYQRFERARLQSLQDRLVHAARLDRAAGRFTEFQTVALMKSDQSWTTFGQVEGRGGGEGTYAGPHLRYREHDADVCVHVALTLEPAGDAPDLVALAAALDAPARPLFIGRKPCLPAVPVGRGLVEAASLLDALTATPLVPDRTWPPRTAIPVELPLTEAAPEGFRRIHRTDRRDWGAGVHTGDSLRWAGSLPRTAFAAGDAPWA